MTEELKITTETARASLYRLDGMIASDDGMIIENALTLWEEDKELIEKLQQQNKQLIEALEFYADTEKHRMKHRGKMAGYRMDVSTDVAEDNGYKARTALQQIQGNKT